MKLDKNCTFLIKNEVYVTVYYFFRDQREDEENDIEFENEQDADDSQPVPNTQPLSPSIAIS